MDFIKELEEARLTRNASNVKSLTYSDCCERAYLTLLILELLRNYPKSKRQAQLYATKTLEKDDYSQFRAFGTDLYNFLYFIMGDEDAFKRLRDPGSAKRLRQNTTLPHLSLNRYLRALKSNTTPSNVQAFLMQLESALHISNTDYKLVRRNIGNFQRLSPKDKQDVATKLLFAARAKLRSSDIIDDLSALISSKDLETSRVKDTEPQISTPDLSIDSADLAMYRLLVGTDNLMRTKKFLELAKNGNGIPPQFVQGYMPIIQMIDDIVKSGVAPINLLKTIHQRAKKTSK